MADAYGRAFTSQYGIEPNEVWVLGLDGFSDDEIREGYEAALADNREFVPNLSTLIGYIRGADDWESKHLHKPYDPNAAIEDKGEGRLLEHNIEPMSAEDALAKMKSTMGLS